MTTIGVSRAWIHKWTILLLDTATTALGVPFLTVDAIGSREESSSPIKKELGPEQYGDLLTARSTVTLHRKLRIKEK